MKKQHVQSPDINRRHFLKTVGLSAGGLVIAFHLPACSRLERDANTTDTKKSVWEANGFVRIAADSQITILVNHQEMGQGVYTALPMLVAEELDADWNSITVKLAPHTPEYHHATYKMRLTGGSTSVSSSWEALRVAGAMARALIVDAAAQQWGVAANTLQTQSSTITDPASGREASYGSLIETAAQLPTPEQVNLKDPKDFKIIGTEVKRLEGLEKVTGQAAFSLDFKLPNMLTAVVARPPIYGDKVKHYQADKALSQPGVVKIKQISTGVAVIAKDFWSAKVARDLLEIEWESGPAAGFSTTQQQQHYRQLAEQSGPVAEDVGNAPEVLKTAERTVEAVYEVPYLAHACMEPLSCTAQVSENAC
ncbi:molybdopterin-dependent oxidoreductase, partial [Porticoccaceae bacterium]|nr:molybdopterin-dependent oxidoreductase [Porticoccaceae bacterium]